MISDARGGHVSPGVYTEERDVTYAVKTLGITSLGLAGETLKGPAFQPILINDWGEFVDYFGGTSTEKFDATGYPKYELPYIAKSYLQESKQLYVSRALGLSGYKAPSAMVVAVKDDEEGKTMPLVIFRSKGEYTSGEGSMCDTGATSYLKPSITGFSIAEYEEQQYDANCAINAGEKTTYPITNVSYESGMTGFKVIFSGEGETTYVYNVSLNKAKSNYIYNIFGTNPNEGSAPVFVEALYDYAFEDMINAHKGTGSTSYSYAKIDSNTQNEDYKEYFRCAVTPWVVSEVKDATTDTANLKTLFKFYTISDGNAANYQVKISIQNIRPEKGTFDVVIRDFYDTDDAILVLEKYSNCSMVEGNDNFIGLKIGTSDGRYPSRSKYVTVKMSGTEGAESCVPAGFLGYPIPNYGCGKKVDVAYNTTIDFGKKIKRQYFGLNSDILDVDILNYKGKDAYNNATDDFDSEKITYGFHLDSILSKDVSSGLTIFVNGESGFSFTTVSGVQGTAAYVRLPRITTEEYMKETIYSDINARKFTLYPYGGFDGWDIYRKRRTNSDDFKVTNINYHDYADENSIFTRISSTELDLNETLNLNLPANAITSDYYAYLAAIRQFANPQDIDLNLLATPGIDWINNGLLVEDALDMVEDPDDGRGGDTLYVVTTPQVGENGQNYTPMELVDLLEDSSINSSYACTYYPWVKYFDQTANMYIDLPVTKDVVRNMAATDNTSFPWFTPAGVSRGSVDCQSAVYKTTLSDEDTLYEGFINPVKSFAVDGVKIWGNKTMYNVDSPLNRINVRRLMLRIKKLITAAAKNLIFEQYDETLEKQFRSLVEPVLNDAKNNRGIVDYRVITESTPETRDQHILPAKILVKPIPSLEYISISFVVYPESISFDEN